MRTTSNAREKQEKKRDSGESETIQRVGENIKKVTNIFREKREDPLKQQQIMCKKETIRAQERLLEITNMTAEIKKGWRYNQGNLSGNKKPGKVQ